MLFVLSAMFVAVSPFILHHFLIPCILVFMLASSCDHKVHSSYTSFFLSVMKRDLIKQRRLDGCWASYKIKQPIPTALTLSLFCSLLLLSSPAHLNKLTPLHPPMPPPHVSLHHLLFFPCLSSLNGQAAVKEKDPEISSCFCTRTHFSPFTFTCAQLSHNHMRP